ncbi:unnamed protein product [Spirodela intermedia]|uniref:Uncharacterized protein n=1 Tax=Spirodela intermedia TaxID=51605 RepID=A0A7I8JNX9_SPIIN|nr:unnamed protein product [Spirodela intermedia]CAA6671162.1 unnamed protein product [Spirodela intermedia]
MGDEAKGEEGGLRLVLVTRKGGFALPTACPSCLPVYVSLKLAKVPFDLHFDSKNPDSDHIPFIEFGDYVAYNNENGGVIDRLKEDGIVDLDSSLPGQSFPDWLSMKAMLWVESDGSTADTIYFSDLPWPIRKVLHWKQSRAVRNIMGITKLNAAEREGEIYRKAKQAYKALSLRLGDQTFFFENRPTSLDAVFLGHALFVLQASPETSTLRKLLSSHDNLVKYVENLKGEFLEAGSSSSSMPGFPSEPPTSSTSAKPSSHWTWSSKPKPKEKRERTEEEKAFRRRAKYFLLTQLVSVVVFLTLLGPIAAHEELEMDEDDDDLSYEY